MSSQPCVRPEGRTDHILTSADPATLTLGERRRLKHSGAPPEQWRVDLGLTKAQEQQIERVLIAAFRSPDRKRSRPAPRRREQRHGRPSRTGSSSATSSADPPGSDDDPELPPLSPAAEAAARRILRREARILADRIAGAEQVAA